MLQTGMVLLEEEPVSDEDGLQKDAETRAAITSSLARAVTSRDNSSDTKRINNNDNNSLEGTLLDRSTRYLLSTSLDVDIGLPFSRELRGLGKTGQNRRRNFRRVRCVPLLQPGVFRLLISPELQQSHLARPPRRHRKGHTQAQPPSLSLVPTPYAALAERRQQHGPVDFALSCGLFELRSDRTVASHPDGPVLSTIYADVPLPAHSTF